MIPYLRLATFANLKTLGSVKTPISVLAVGVASTILYFSHRMQYLNASPCNLLASSGETHNKRGARRHKFGNYARDATFRRPPPYNWVVLLTTWLDRTYAEERLFHERLYTDVIWQWLNKTSLPIFVVESSGFGFPSIQHPRLSTIVFNDTEPKPASDLAKTVGEARSMIYALRQMRNATTYQMADYILKVTGRYYLEGIEDDLRTVVPDQDLYVQKHRWNGGYQHTEYFGARKGLIEALSLLALRNPSHNLEHAFYYLSEILTYSYLSPTGFPNDYKMNGGALKDPLI